MTSRQIFQYTLVVLGTLAAAYILLMSVRILMDLLIAVVIASAIRPLVVRLVYWKVSEGLAIFSVYLAILAMTFILMILLLPPTLDEALFYVEHDSQLADRIIDAQDNLQRSLEDISNRDVSLVPDDNIRQAVSDITDQIRGSSPNLLDDFSSTLGETVMIVVMGAYWLTSRTKALDFISQLFSPQYRIRVQNIVDEIEFSLGGYVRGVVSVGFVIGFLNFLIMSAAGVPNAAMLGLIIGITTMIPMIGGFAGGAIAVLLTLIVSPNDVMVVAAIAFLMQLVESYYVSPSLMSRSVNIDPLLIIVYTLIGFAMFGIIGALIAVPAMGIIHILLRHLIIDPHRESIRLFRFERGVIVMNGGVAEVKESMSEMPIIETAAK